MFRPEALRPDPWFFSQFPAQRWLLGFGAILAWMLLFHLLVNVWLLCVFTSMLLVLGGWLGSQAALDSGSFIHLERFMALERLQSSPEGEQQLDREIRSMVHKIVRDFVSSWYRTVSSEPLFEEEVERAMLAIATELKQRARMVDRRALTTRLLELCGVHLRSYLAAREMAAKEEGASGLWELYCRSCIPHPALRSDAEQYETAVDAENVDPAPPVAYHTVNRRYSEFLNLQSRLEEKPELRKILKNVKGPKKIFPDLPFGNMDTDRVEARKGLLETFLKQLCAIPETANSEEMQEFLALNTDARIAFVKKSFIVSRIDKIVVNAIVDTLKTAFPRSEPQSPTEDGDAEPDGKTQLDKKNKSRLKFSSKATPVLNVASVQPRVLYCFEEGGTVFGGLSLDGLEVFVAEQERMVGRVSAPEAVGERAVRLGGLVGQLQVSASKATAAETGLADVAQDVLGLLMKDQWGWLCTENMQKTIRLLFGTLIDRWLEVRVANLTCTQYWVVYLQLLQEAIWPGGLLPAWPCPQRTPQQKEDTWKLTLLCLMKLLPDRISNLLGPEKYKLSWQVVLDSLQEAQINRHLVCSIWDLLLEFLIPESSSEDFQKILLGSLSG
ncbi:sorting nexin-19 isoform X3 [Paramormyrops kingsleyae]|uniref:sorting nexin-19 isoform X3 n=1 Tax=Paramormyrops kingsleyae TaxID=1676925 RepID=UPI003B9776CC